MNSCPMRLAGSDAGSDRWVAGLTSLAEFGFNGETDRHRYLRHRAANVDVAVSPGGCCSRPVLRS